MCFLPQRRSLQPVPTLLLLWSWAPVPLQRRRGGWASWPNANTIFVLWPSTTTSNCRALPFPLATAWNSLDTACKEWLPLWTPLHLPSPPRVSGCYQDVYIILKKEFTDYLLSSGTAESKETSEHTQRLPPQEDGKGTPSGEIHRNCGIAGELSPVTQRQRGSVVTNKFVPSSSL